MGDPLGQRVYQAVLLLPDFSLIVGGGQARVQEVGSWASSARYHLTGLRTGGCWVTRLASLDPITIFICGIGLKMCPLLPH